MLVREETVVEPTEASEEPEVLEELEELEELEVAPGIKLDMALTR